MPKVGDRVIVEGNKVGQQRREGTLLQTVGSLIKVRWGDGTESMFTPGAGAVRFETGNGKAPKQAANKGGPKAAPAKAKGAAKAKKAKTPVKAKKAKSAAKAPAANAGKAKAKPKKK